MSAGDRKKKAKPMHIDNAKIAMMYLFDQLISSGLEARFTKSNPSFPHSLSRMALGWLFPMLDYVMTGDEPVGRMHKRFLNEVLANSLLVSELNAADKVLRKSRAVFDPELPPAFLLITEKLQPGFGQSIYEALDLLIQAATAWAGERTPQDIARAEQVLRPIRQYSRIASSKIPTSDATLKASLKLTFAYINTYGADLLRTIEDKFKAAGQYVHEDGESTVPTSNAHAERRLRQEIKASPSEPSSTPLPSRMRPAKQSPPPNKPVNKLDFVSLPSWHFQLPFIVAVFATIILFLAS